jgi:hypothetical protein
MISITNLSRQPTWEAWTMECLNTELTINLKMAIEHVTHDNYSSALNSYLNLLQTAQPWHWTNSAHTHTFVTFQSAHINPKSVDTYLSSIANQLETHFPNVQCMQKCYHILCFAGCKMTLWCTNISQTSSNQGQSDHHFQHIQTHPHNDLLFTTQILTGTDCLMCLAEITWLDKVSLHDYCKVSMCHSVEFLMGTLSFWLPGHKADKFFKGNCLIVRKSAIPNMHACFIANRVSHNSLFPIWPELWLHANRTIPTCSWFIARLQHFFPNSITGQLLHAGSATALTEAGTAPNLIQTVSHWTSNTFMCYIHKNPFLFEALLVGHSSLLS